MHKKPVAVILVVILVINLILFSTGILGSLIFWSIISVIAILAYQIFPKTS